MIKYFSTPLADATIMTATDQIASRLSYITVGNNITSMPATVQWDANKGTGIKSDIVRIINNAIEDLEMLLAAIPVEMIKSDSNAINANAALKILQLLAAVMKITAVPMSIILDNISYTVKLLRES